MKTLLSAIHLVSTQSAPPLQLSKYTGARALRRSALTILLCSATVGLVLLGSPTAQAQSRASAVFFGSGAAASLNDMGLGVTWMNTEPAPLRDKNLRIDGSGPLWGGGLKLILGEGHYRGGLGINLFGARGFNLRHAALPQGISTTTGSFWGETVDLFFGREVPLGPVRLYGELRMAFTVFQALVELNSTAYGALGTTPYDGFSFGLGPRLGLILPLGSNFFVDLTAYGSPLGAEKFASTLGIGLVVPDYAEEKPVRRRRRRVPATW